MQTKGILSPTRILGFFFLSLVFTDCNESNQFQKPTLDKEALSNTLNSNSTFQILVDVHTAFLNEVEKNYASLSKAEKEKFSDIHQKFNSFSSVDDLVTNTSKDEIAFVLRFSKMYGQLASPLEKLMGEIQSKYNFDFTDFSEIVSEKVNSKLEFASEKNGRVQLSCRGTCSNKAEAYYWKMYQATRDVSLSGYSAGVYYAGCLDGCIQ